jgi:hypothetical protein
VVKVAAGAERLAAFGELVIQGRELALGAFAGAVLRLS